MLPIARKPIVQYVAEELLASGVQDVLFVTGRGKSSIENHFDADPELAAQLAAGNKTDLLKEVEFGEMPLNFFYTRQRVQRGLGDAILCGESFAGDQPFVVALGDSIIGLNAQSGCVRRMIELFETKRASCVVAVEEVPENEVSQYGIVQPADEDGDSCRVSNLVEKPSISEAPSRLAIAGRYVFAPVIFDMIRQVKPDKRGEIQLTNAMKMLCEEGRRVFAVKLAPDEKRYDIGNFPSYYETFVEFALADPEHGPAFRLRLREILDGK